MKVALILCPGWDQTYPPFSLALLSACLKSSGHQPVLFDLNKNFWMEHRADYLRFSWGDKARIGPEIAGERAPYFQRFIADVLAAQADLIGFSLFPSNEGISIALAQMIKEADPSRRVVFGGVTCFDLEKCLEYVSRPQIDAVICGEGDRTLPALADALERSAPPESVPGVITKKGGGAPSELARVAPADLDSLPTADFSVYDLSRYPQRELTLETSRGCVRRCVFCDDWQRWKKFRQKSAGRIVGQMQELLARHPETRGFFFADSIVNGDMRQLEGVADLLLQENIRTRWTGYAIVRPEMTPRLLDKLRRSGGESLFFGIESGSDKVSREMDKPVPSRLKSKVLQDVKRSGLSNVVFMMVGFPTETEEDFQQTLSFVEKNAGAIDHLGLNLCDISYMKDGVERYGIKEGGHHAFWETSDGSNTFPIRLERLKRATKLAGEFGVEVEFAKQLPDFGKQDCYSVDYFCETMLARYHYLREELLDSITHQHKAQKLARQWTLT